MFVFLSVVLLSEMVIPGQIFENQIVRARKSILMK
jgi:hypothetical protein